MNKKKRTIFLIISLTIFMLSAIIIIVHYCEVKAAIDEILSETKDTQIRVGLELSLFWNILFAVGVLGTELSFIRSIYKMIKYNPKVLIKMFYIISASFAFLAVAFYYIATAKMFNFIGDNVRNYLGNIYLFTLWPSFIISFILGSIPIKRN